MIENNPSGGFYRTREPLARDQKRERRDPPTYPRPTPIDTHRSKKKSPRYRPHRAENEKIDGAARTCCRKDRRHGRPLPSSRSPGVLEDSVAHLTTFSSLPKQVRWPSPAAPTREKIFVNAPLLGSLAAALHGAGLPRKRLDSHPRMYRFSNKARTTKKAARSPQLPKNNSASPPFPLVSVRRTKGYGSRRPKDPDHEPRFHSPGLALPPGLLRVERVLSTSPNHFSFFFLSISFVTKSRPPTHCMRAGGFCAPCPAQEKSRAC